MTAPTSGYRCAHCGQGGLSMLGHLAGETFTCLEGRENEAARLAGRPARWSYGAPISCAEPRCATCFEPLICPKSKPDPRGGLYHAVSAIASVDGERVWTWIVAVPPEAT